MSGRRLALIIQHKLTNLKDLNPRNYALSQDLSEKLAMFLRDAEREFIFDDLLTFKRSD